MDHDPDLLDFFQDMAELGHFRLIAAYGSTTEALRRFRVRSVIPGGEPHVVGVWPESPWRPTGDHGRGEYLQRDVAGPLPS